MDVIYDFVKNFLKTRYKDIPKPAIESVKMEVLDSLATALGGSSKAGVTELVDIIKEWGGTPQSTVIAYGIKCPAPNAAQVNGTMIHALDFDDGHPVALVHIGCVAVSTCFAIAERMGKVSGKDFITAIALGADFAARLGLASRPGSSLISSGWHPTTLYGYLSSAAMAGKIMGLNEEKMVNALGIAYHQCAGNAQCGMDGALTKRMGPGLASRGGITSALMAERGITGVKNILQGKAGMFNLYHGGDYDPNILIADLGKRFEGVKVDYKRYPCCGFTHPFIEATLSLKSRHKIDPGQVKKITAYAGESAYGLCLPAETKNTPQTIVDAQFSLPWTIATAMVKGKVTVDDFTIDSIKNKNVIKISRKVTGVLEPSMSRHGVGPGRVTVTMKDGAEFTAEESDAFKPMTFEDSSAKFKDCVACSIKPLPRKKVEKVIGMVSKLETLDDATEIIRLLG